MTGIEDFQSIDFDTPEAMDFYADETPGLTTSQIRRIKAEVKDWRSELGQDFVSGLDNYSEVIAKEVARLDDAEAEDCREAMQIPADLRTGRIDSKEAMKRLAQLTRNRDDYAARLASITENVARWEENSEADPSDLLRQRQKRFATGVPRYGRRSLTARMLRGDR